MSKETKTEPKKTVAEEEAAEEYLVKYKSTPTSTTQQGNIYNIIVQIGQPPLPPYKP